MRIVKEDLVDKVGQLKTARFYAIFEIYFEFKMTKNRAAKSLPIIVIELFNTIIIFILTSNKLQYKIAQKGGERFIRINKI